MRRYVTHEYRGYRLIGREHIPDNASGEPMPVGLLLPGMDGSNVGPERLWLQLSIALERIGIASYRFDLLGTGRAKALPRTSQLRISVSRPFTSLTAFGWTGASTRSACSLADSASALSRRCWWQGITLTSSGVCCSSVRR